MLFTKEKIVKVQYGIYTDLEAPKAIYPNIESLNNHKDLKCPAVNSVSNKVYGAKSYLEAEIEVHYDKAIKDLRFRYNFNDDFHPASNSVHQLIKDIIILNTDNGKHTIQLLSPYVFLTNDKDLEICSMQPNLEVKNLEYVIGGFKPYGWARPLNVSYALIDNNKTASIKLDLSKFMMKYIFNKPVNLEYVSFNSEQLEFINSCKGAIKYRKNINKLYKTHSTRRKKDILQ